VIPALVQAFRQDSHPGVRWQAAAALERTARYYREHQTAEVVAELKEVMAILSDDPHPDIHRNAEAIHAAILQIENPQAPR
jgi:hypothetical protein